jgi:hypothetical protein
MLPGRWLRGLIQPDIEGWEIARFGEKSEAGQAAVC